MRKLIIFLSFLFLSGCLPSASFPPLTFQGLDRPLKPGDIIATRSGEIISPDTLIDHLSENQVVYVGETHTSLADHRIQFQILEGLYRKNPELVLALEMFPRRVQPVLDRFAAGALTEEDFIREVNWAEVWGYPFQLYRPLLTFARDRGLKIVGLNAPREVVNKIARQGLAALSPEERREVAEMFLTEDSKYREALALEFQRHRSEKIKDFDSFYEAQRTWDETMAETLVRTLQTRPSSAQALVVIGKGHITDRMGMPPAAARRWPQPYKTVVPVPIDYPLRVLDPNLADYLWITEAFMESHPPRLGLQVKPLGSGRGLEVLEVTPGGPAARAGFRTGDVIIRAGGEPVRSVEDLHRLFSGRPEKVSFTLMRSGRELTLEVSWQAPVEKN